MVRQNCLLLSGPQFSTVPVIAMVLVGESSPPSDLEASAPLCHKHKKLGTWLKLANQRLESDQATTSSSKEVENDLLATKPYPDSNIP